MKTDVTALTDIASTTDSATVSPNGSPRAIVEAVRHLSMAIECAIVVDDRVTARALARCLNEVLEATDVEPASVIDLTKARKRRGDDRE